MGGEGVSHEACEWDPDRAQLASVGPLAMPHGATVLPSPPTLWPRAEETGSARLWGLEAELSVCTRAPGCACLSVCGVGEGGWQTGKGGSDSGEKDWGLERSQSPREENFGGNASLPSPGLCRFS